MDKSIIKRVDTVFVPVTDIERSEQWYLKFFPFYVGYRSEDGSYVGFRFEEPGSLKTGLTIYQCEELPNITHIPFNFYTSDVDESYEMFKENGVTVSEIHEAGGMRFFDFNDPDGNVLGIVTF